MDEMMTLYTNNDPWEMAFYTAEDLKAKGLTPEDFLTTKVSKAAYESFIKARKEANAFEWSIIESLIERNLIEDPRRPVKGVF